MPAGDSAKTVVVLGAGAIGVSTALMLQQRGYAVVLIDRKLPASETSGGNAGIIGDSAAVPFNNPGLRRELGHLLFGKSAALRCDWRYVSTQMPWLVRFFAHTNAASAKHRTLLLHQLICRSQTLHRQWMTTCRLAEQLRKSGWLKCYRGESGWVNARDERALWDELGIRYEVLDARQLNEKSSALRPVFVRGVYLPDALSVLNPQIMIRAYADWFIAEGGRFIQANITTLQADKQGWKVSLQNNETICAQNAVIALGPWSKDFLKTLSINLPMAYERGSHRNFAVIGETINMPLADVDGGYIAIMQKDTLRVTSGVYFADRRVRHSTEQLDIAERYLRECADGIGDAVGDDWFGARPTMSDSLPIIGPAKQNGLWLATAHQHIGLTTAPATGEIIAEWISGNKPMLTEFSPARFGI